ncbi:molybdopterin-synthase adenylyltransferase MoeB [Nostocoides sp. F2B08]|uniref:molybdopterin-synthase adenylyltransferase MoeB n=1 Tax=Nostocoides sp. F2B08 TaxID=2653936 RepID=UPI001263C506|nr:molybdopterin-synthase adenylyltransferase MoeB [Tetrasphaera sp. F2B08]KAB7746217.1 molybdopterin-synthase adenylyltransferase MoeB [Tetrasphaera sp. F2B08]
MEFAPLVEPGPPLSEAERRRYARHTRLAEIGDLGQRRLAAARVLVVGAGGLGSPALTYLAAAGVGTIGVIDDDVVETSNLHRQPLHSDADVGRPKVDSAADRLREVNPHVVVRTHPRRFSAEGAEELLTAYDLVVDGADNFAARYLVTDACALAGVPHVWASINAFAGQLSVWWAGRGPCYRCVFPEAPPPGSVASCAETGVIGALPGVMGALQAAEAVKLITGAGRPAVGRIILHDALEGTWGEVPVRSRADCPLCGVSPTITEVRSGEEPPPVPLVSVTELRTRLGHEAADREVVLDVREAEELAEGRIEPSVHVPLGALVAGDAADLVDRWRAEGASVVAYCRSGVRSAHAAAYLLSVGVGRVASLGGGILAWDDEVDRHEPVVPAGRTAVGQE